MFVGGTAPKRKGIMITFTKKTTGLGGTSLKGYITTTYTDLVRIFGRPSYEFGDKTTAEWILEFSDGTVATIYDWKEYETPEGMYDWHIGGNSAAALSAVQEAMGWKWKVTASRW